MDLRKHTRAHSHLRIAYRSSKNSPYIYTLTNDISESGLNLNLDSDQRSEQNLDLLLYPTGDKPPLEYQARIVWKERFDSEKKALFRQSGLEFISPTEEEKRRLRDLVNDALKEEENGKGINFLEKLSSLNESLDSRQNFIRASEQLSMELFAVEVVRLLLPERRIKTKEALEAWSKNLKISSGDLIIPILARGSLVGHLEVKNQSAKLSNSTLNQLKHWAGCLSAFCSSFLCDES